MMAECPYCGKWYSASDRHTCSTNPPDKAVGAELHEQLRQILDEPMTYENAKPMMENLTEYILGKAMPIIETEIASREHKEYDRGHKDGYKQGWDSAGGEFGDEAKAEAVRKAVEADELDIILLELTGKTPGQNLGVSYTRNRLKALIHRRERKAVEAFAISLPYEQLEPRGYRYVKRIEVMEALAHYGQPTNPKV